MTTKLSLDTAHKQLKQQNGPGKTKQNTEKKQRKLKWMANRAHRWH